MMSWTDTNPDPDILVVLAAQASVSVCGSTPIRCYPSYSLPQRAGTLIYLAQHARNTPPLRIMLSPGTLDPGLAWLDRTFAALELRLCAAPDQDLLEAAEDLATRLGSRDKTEMSDDWIESIAESWSRLRD